MRLIEGSRSVFQIDQSTALEVMVPIPSGFVVRAPEIGPMASRTVMRASLIYDGNATLLWTRVEEPFTEAMEASGGKIHIGARRFMRVGMNYTLTGLFPDDGCMSMFEGIMAARGVW